jgi:hypothetical protein
VERLRIVPRARQPGACPTPQLTLSRASDIDHSKEPDRNQDATRLQVPPRVSRADKLSGSKDSGKVQKATRLQLTQSNDILLERQDAKQQRVSQ